MTARLVGAQAGRWQVSAAPVPAKTPMFLAVCIVVPIAAPRHAAARLATTSVVFVQGLVEQKQRRHSEDESGGEGAVVAMLGLRRRRGGEACGQDRSDPFPVHGQFLIPVAPPWGNRDDAALGRDERRLPPNRPVRQYRSDVIR